MKKYTKILGIVLCLAMLIGILPIAATADPETTTWLDLIAESTITPHVGYYVDGDMDNLTDEEPAEAEYLTDAHVGTGSWMHGADWPAPSGAVIATVLELDSTKSIGAVELVARPNYGLTDFTVEVYTTAGTWQEVLAVTDNATDGTTFHEFTPVEGSQVRLLINDWKGDHPMLQELSVYEAKTGTPKVQIPVASVSANQNPTVPADSVENIIDGNRYNVYQIGAGNMPVQITFDTTNTDGSANNFSGMTIFAYRADRSGVADFIIDVQTEPNGDWTQVHTGTAYTTGHTDTFVLDLAQSYAAYAVRLTVNSSTAQGLCLPEVRLFGSGETYAPPATEAPSQPETQPSDPTQGTEPTGEPTEPATALPEAPVVSVGATTIENGVTIEGDVYKKVNNRNITAQFGFYNAAGNFVDKMDGSCVTDGWYGRAGYSECTSADGQIALILTLAEAKNIGGMVICPRGGYPDNVPAQFEIQVMVGGNWQTVVEVTENAFTNGYTVGYTFPAVVTNQVRLLVNAVANPSQQCYLDEVELYEVTTGKLYNDIDLNGKVTDSNAFGNNPASNLTDGDKTSNTTGSNYTISLTDAEGNPTSIDGLRMYFHRGNANIIGTANIMIQKTIDGEFESIGEFMPGWNSGDPREVYIAEFDQTYVAYAIKLNFDTNAPSHEFELFQYQKVEAPELPTEPSEPTEPSAPATEPEATEPSAPATEPEATEPSAPATEPEATEPSAPATEPEATEPEATEPEATDPEDIYDQFDLTELEATFALIDTLDLEGYTEESLEELAYAIEIAFLVLMDENLTQEMIDEVNAMLLEAIDNLVPVDPDTETPELPDVPALPSTDELFATISIITNLKPTDYTAESYAALIEAVDIVNAMILEAGGAYTQAMLDEANAILTEALAGLVKIGGETPDGETPDDEIPGGEDSDDDNDLPADTGDVAMIILSGMMTLSAVGGAAVIGKKKFF